ncbi:hypothetical protein Scep_015214 [Stephania cephalantha]|uniref:Uncharacterized protein n=1 Tax=Stephania cephalantha TaxID=152367 RepID=A0AAP0P168_9MAGN
MASPTTVLETQTSAAFPAVDAAAELHPAAAGNDFAVDPISSDLAKSKEFKMEAEATEERKRKEKEAAANSLKRTIVIAAVVVAGIGAVFAITKKLREK